MMIDLSELSYLLPFFVATFVFGFVPGPSIMYTLAQTVARGRRGGISAAIGIHIGCFPHIVAAAFGLSYVFKIVPELYIVLKFVGAGYLVYLGVKMILAKTGGDLPVEHIATVDKTTFLNSIMVEVLNPKTAIFFIAFLPQFIDVTASMPVWLQFILLGQFVNMAFSTADLVYVFMAEYVVTKIKKKGGKSNFLNWIGGSLLIGLAGHIMLEK